MSYVNSSTPLSSSDNVTSTIGHHVGGIVLNPENASAAANQAGTFAKEQAEEVKRLASEGDFSIRLFALLGGLAMIVTSILGFIGKFVTLRWVNAIIAVYCFFFGIIMVMLEGRRIPFAKKLEGSLYKYALFLKYVWGRGLLYFVAGTLQISSGGLLELIVGAFVAIVGIAFIIVGRLSAKKLKSLKTSAFSENTLRAEFTDAAGGASHVNMVQFKVLCDSLNVDLNRRELEATWMEVEKADRDEVTFREFKIWWDGADHDVV